ncbi:MAG: ATPase, T2SS/T4P/T4SS family, partial [Thermoplasmata archaeon]
MADRRGKRPDRSQSYGEGDKNLKVCPKCGTLNSPIETNCRMCATPLPRTPQPPPSATPQGSSAPSPGMTVTHGTERRYTAPPKSPDPSQTAYSPPPTYTPPPQQPTPSYSPPPQQTPPPAPASPTVTVAPSTERRYTAPPRPAEQPQQPYTPPPRISEPAYQSPPQQTPAYAQPQSASPPPQPVQQPLWEARSTDMSTPPRTTTPQPQYTQSATPEVVPTQRYSPPGAAPEAQAGYQEATPVLRPTPREPGMERYGRSPLANILQSISKVDIVGLKKGINRILDKNHMFRPGFSSSWVAPKPPDDGTKIREYYVKDAKVELYTIPNQIDVLYHVTLYEYQLPIEHMQLVQIAREELSQHYPKHIQLTRLSQTKTYVTKLGTRLIYKLAKKHGINIGMTRAEEIATVNKLAQILTKYVAGLGVVETMLEDKFVQDVYIDAPASENRVHLRVGGYNDPRIGDKCITNVTVGDEDAEALLSRFRLESGRPFSEAMPVLETDIKEYNTRVTVIGKPLSPEGIAFALRRHSTDPWTLLKLIYLGSISPLGAGLLSFLIDGRSTILVTGSRGSGKTSLVGALMLEFPQSQRIITIEDTLELPVPEMRELGYKVQGIFVQSSLGGKGELTADDALKVSLRLGESAIVLGEVRGQEAKTLYEAMRAGTAGSAVLGTIHGNTPRAIYERVVFDIGIPPKSFNATDIVVVAGLTSPGGTQKQLRRITQISEVVKEEGKEGQFNDLMKYDEHSDTLLETEVFKKNSERIKAIADSWGIDYWDAIQNIGVRAAYRAKIVEYAKSYNKPQVLTAKWVAASNNAFWQILEKHYSSKKKLDYVALLNEWNKWFERSVK